MWEGKQLGPFFVEKEIGSGAMGTVYRAIHTKKRKRVAIKVVSVDLQKNPKALARFDGNVSQAAGALGLSRSALYRRLQRYGM